MIIDLEERNFEDCVMNEGIALIDCWAPWCVACKDYTPTFEAAAKRHRSHAFAKLNTHDQSDLAKKLKISHIPTTVLFRDGLLLLRQPGYLNHDEIDEAISKAESLNMERVKADMKNRLTGDTA